jgi:hypothetical protein
MKEQENGASISEEEYSGILPELASTTFSSSSDMGPLQSRIQTPLSSFDQSVKTKSVSIL